MQEEHKTCGCRYGIRCQDAALHQDVNLDGNDGAQQVAERLAGTLNGMSGDEGKGVSGPRTIRKVGPSYHNGSYWHAMVTWGPKVHGYLYQWGTR